MWWRSVWTTSICRNRAADHEQVVSAGDGHLDRAFHMALAFDVAEIDLVILVGGKERSEIAMGRCDQRFPADELERLPKILDAIDG